ncbi:MAG: radical SAM protein [Planctomycetota bacterium]|jgi:organic radical activating enzyme
MAGAIRRLARALLSRLPSPVRRAVVRTVVPPTPHAKIPRVYPTLKCNLNCPFCSDGLDYDKSHMGYAPLTTERWIEIVDALPGNAVIFTGGEPTLFAGLPDVINAVHQDDLYLYTNLFYNVEKFFDRLTKPVKVFGSFHPNNKGVTAERIIANLRLLQAHPMCRYVANVHTINHPSNGDVDEHRRTFQAHGLDLDIHQDQFITNANTPAACDGRNLRTVRCAFDRIIIGPDGRRWICVSKMIRNVQDGLVPMDQTEVPELVCHEFGRCSPCDEVAQITLLDEKVPART